MARDRGDNDEDKDGVIDFLARTHVCTHTYTNRAYTHTLKIRARLLPRILDGKSSAFTLSGCSFKLSPSKASTMRVVMYHEMNITCAYTLEASFGGKDGVHYGVGDLEEVGWEFAESLREFWRYLKDEDGAVTGVKRSLGSKEEGDKVGFDLDSDDGVVDEVKDSVRKYIEAEYIRVQRAEEEEENESAGSESDPSGDNMDEDERRKRVGRKKKGKKKSSKSSSDSKISGTKGKKKEADKKRGGVAGAGSGVGVGLRGRGGERGRAVSADSSSNKVPKIPAGEVYRMPKRPEGRRTRRSFETITSQTPRASMTKGRAEDNELSGVRPRPRRAVSAGGVGSMRIVRKRAASSSAQAEARAAQGDGNKNIDPRFVTVEENRNKNWRGPGVGGGDVGGGIEQAVIAGIGPRVGSGRGSGGGGIGRRNSQGEGGKRKEKVKEEIRKVRKDLENHLEFNVMKMGGGGGA